MKITVLPRPIEDTESTYDGVTRLRSKQWCVLEIDGLPTAFQVTTERGKSYPPGEYDLDGKSFSLTNGRLQVTNVVLRPAVAARAPAASQRAAGQ